MTATQASLPEFKSCLGFLLHHEHARHRCYAFRYHNVNIEYREYGSVSHIFHHAFQARKF